MPEVDHSWLYELARDGTLTMTILACLFLWANQAVPVKTVQTDYCVVNFHAGAFDENHKLHTGWVHGYGPCSLLDRYEEI